MLHLDPRPVLCLQERWLKVSSYILRVTLHELKLHDKMGGLSAIDWSASFCDRSFTGWSVASAKGQVRRMERNHQIRNVDLTMKIIEN